MTAQPDPAAQLPPELRGELARILAKYPPGVRVAGVRPGAGGNWVIDLETSDGEDAGNFVLTRPTGAQ